MNLSHRTDGRVRRSVPQVTVPEKSRRRSPAQRLLRSQRSMAASAVGTVRSMSPVRVRPLGGAMGCLIMILVSVVLSVLLTVVLNLIAR